MKPIFAAIVLGLAALAAMCIGGTPVTVCGESDRRVGWQYVC